MIKEKVLDIEIKIDLLKNLNNSMINSKRKIYDLKINIFFMVCIYLNGEKHENY